MAKFDQAFRSELQRLNKSQRVAVNTIEGPVMVLAGPGTGKTQLLSMRVANILRETDVNPENILCLTFTDAAAQNMTKRMAELFGPSAYDVAVHTFHSFASNAFGRYSDYFFRGAQFATADELTKLEIINDILRDLPHDNPLSGTHDDKATRLGEVQKAISTLKRKGGLTSKNLSEIAKENLNFINFAEPILTEIFADKISIKNIAIYKSGYEKLASFSNQKSSLAQIVINDFADAINDAILAHKTNAITAFKNRIFNSKSKKMSDRTKSENIAALGEVYEKYQAELAARELYDFDDMIVELIDKLKNNADFHADLQEQYQYILVDEFQDTNDAQMQILTLLADAPDSNIMVVGDDDQAIYSFQGANQNNMRSFIKKYPSAKMIQLFENYRSEKCVLDLAEQIIGQSENRIKQGFFESLCQLLMKKEHEDNEKIEFISAATEIDELAWVAEQTANELADDPTREIAIIAREHKDLETIVPFLHRAGVQNIDYERRSSILDSPPIVALINLARIVCLLADGAHVKANELLPELLANEAWNVPAKTIWKLSLNAKNRDGWLEMMLENEELKSIAEWLIEMSKAMQNLPMESAIDVLFDKAYKGFYFSDQKLANEPNIYLNFLSDLITLRENIRTYSVENPTLKTFVNIIDLHKKYGQKILANRQFGDQARVHLLSVHKAKGLEFDTVFMLRGTRNKWLKKSSERFFPSNLRLNLPYEMDENLRLIFVAVTRAKHRLFITAPLVTNTKGDDLSILPILGDIAKRKIVTNSNPIESLETAWNAKLTEVNSDLKKLLAPRLASYQLNATAVNAFTNLEYAGPESFLQNQLLRFPSTKSAAADYGTAVHNTMKFAHEFFTKNNEKPNDIEIKNVFEKQLCAMHLPAIDHKFYLQKGFDNLPNFIAKHEFNKHQKVEQTFDAKVGEMRLTGKMDLIEIDEKTKTIIVTDYKTGPSFDKFNRGKIKSHTYWQQLMFYKLLIENANNRPGYQVEKGVVQFVEADDDEPRTLEIDYASENMDDFVQLLNAIWQHIMDLDFPDTSDYATNLRGTLDFEKYLRGAK